MATVLGDAGDMQQTFIRAEGSGLGLQRGGKVKELLLYGLANQAEIFWIGCGRSAEFLAKISADLVEKKG